MTTDGPSPAAASFGDDAAAYARYRPTYPDIIYQILTDALTGPRETCIELGAGRGKASLTLAEIFSKVISVEPDARMLAHMPPHPAIQTLNMSAEDARFEAGSADAVVCATCFHWMDQPLILKQAHDWLRPGGVFYAFLYGPIQLLGAAQTVFRKHRTLWAPYRDKALGRKADYGAALKANGQFAKVTSHNIDHRFELSAEDAASLFLTTSYASAYAHETSDIMTYHAQLRAELSAAAPIVQVKLPLGGVTAVKLA